MQKQSAVNESAEHCLVFIKSQSPCKPALPAAIGCCAFVLLLKVTAQFETEGNGLNVIVSHMDRQEVRL